MEHDIRPWGEYWVLEDADSHKEKEYKLILEEDYPFSIITIEQKFGLLFPV